MSLDELARATCAIWVDGRRRGTGTLVTDAHILTAGHVLKRGEALAIRFRDGLSGEAIPVAQVLLRADAEELDIAVLKLRSGTDDKPLPAQLWPTKRLPLRTKTFGYPISEGAAPRGVWRDSAVGGPVQGGRVQLDWIDVGTLDGHSGSPVCDEQSGLIVGILVEGAEAGHFDRMVPLSAIRNSWDGLPRPWLFAGQNARAHFTQRAAGQQSMAVSGDLFQGRQVALTLVRNWLHAEPGPGPRLPLVVTGQTGAGKSAVLARAVLGIESARQRDGVAFHARGASIAEFVDAVAAACDVGAQASWQELVKELAGREVQDITVVAVDALDEAASDHDRAELRRALRDLAQLDRLRIAVASRPLTAGDPYRPGTHLYGLGVIGGATSRNLVNLDADRFFAPEDLIAYAEAVLAQNGFVKPGPPGAAWELYRQNAQTRERLARVIASHADRNYLVAYMSAFQLTQDDKVLDPNSGSFDPSAVPGGIGEALDLYLDRLPAQRRRHEAALLTALAYGRGSGLDHERWLAFAHALGFKDVTTGDLDELMDSAAVDFLLETNMDPGRLVTRLFHQALADELVARRDQRVDEGRLVQLLRTEGADSDGWRASSSYTRNYAPSHAAAAGLLDRFVGEVDFLVSMAPAEMKSAMRGLSSNSRQDPVSIYAAAVPFLGNDPASNAAVLELVSLSQGNLALAQELGEMHANRPYGDVGNIRPVVVNIRPLDPGRELARFEGHTDEVLAVAVLGWPGRDHQVIVTASSDQTARVWDPLDGQELACFEGHTDGLRGVAVLGWPGLDHQVIVTTSLDQTARVWDPTDGRELARFEGHIDGLRGVAVLGWPGLDHQVIVTTSYDGTARVWDPLDGQELARFDGDTSWLWGVAALGWPGLDHQVIVTTSFDGTARVWDPLDGQELACFDGHAGVVEGVAALWLTPGPDHPVIVTTSYDGTARVWDPLSPDRELADFGGHTDEVWEAAALAWPGREHQVIVTVSSDKTARVWDPLDAGPELADFKGHTGLVWRVAALAWPGREHQVIVAVSSDKTARVWDPLDGQELARFEGHTAGLQGVAALAWPGLEHQVVVTASFDGTARVWDPLDGQELARFEGHTGDIWGAAALPWPDPDHPKIVTVSSDGTARIWDPHNPQSELANLALLGKGLSVATLDGSAMAVATSRGFLVFRAESWQDPNVQ